MTVENINPIIYGQDDQGHYVKYLSPARKFGNLREELNNDAVAISKAHGPVYVAFSTGVDSQCIMRCFMDMGVEFYPFFLHVRGRNDYERDLVPAAEKFYGIKIPVYQTTLEQHRLEWTRRQMETNYPTCVHYPFDWVSKQLPEDFPMIMSGINEPAVCGGIPERISIFHNYQESLNLRFRLLEQHRPIYDFPYSAESLAAYYTDDIIKTYRSTVNYFRENKLWKIDNQMPMRVPMLDAFNYYIKPFVKGRWFQDDIMWPAKKTGYENYPEWTRVGWLYEPNTSISVPYLDLVDHMESCTGEWKHYRDWIYEWKMDDVTSEYKKVDKR